MGKQYVSKTACKKRKKVKFDQTTKFISDKVLASGMDEYTIAEDYEKSLMV